MATKKAPKGGSRQGASGGGVDKSSRVAGARARETAKARRQKAFLAAFAETGNLTRSAEAAGVVRRQHYEWLEDAGYRKAFADAQAQATDALEAEARRRAVEGVEEPTGWYQGSPGGYVTRYSDTLLMFLMKGANPDKYKERTSVETADVDISTWNSPEDLPFLERLANGESPKAVELDRARSLVTRQTP